MALAKSLPLLSFLIPCQRTLVDTRDSALTLNNVIEDVTFVNPPAVFDPKNTLVYMNWCIVAQWHHEDAHIGNEFDIRIDILLPSGALALSSPGSYKATADRQRTTFTLEGMPIDEPGTLWIKAFIKLKGNRKWNIVGKYPIIINFKEASDP